MKNHYSILVLCLFLSTFAFAQKTNWRHSHLVEGANYHDIVDAQRARLTELRGKSDRRSKKEIKQFERWAEFWRHRVMPDGSFVSSQQHYNAWLESQSDLNKNSSGSVLASWNFLGPIAPPDSETAFYPGMGRVNAIAISPSNVNTMYVGSPSGGIWKTTDGGSTWAAKGDDLPVMGVSDIVIDPNNENILYIATGDFDGQLSFSVGVLKSTDAGESWNTTGLSVDISSVSTISKLLIDPNNSAHIMATTKGSIKRSLDAGATWDDVYDSEGELFNDLQYKIGSPTTVYATVNDGSLLRSTDNGANWTSLSTIGDFERIDLAQTADDTNLLLMLGSYGEIYKSTDQGQNWNQITTLTEFDSQSEYNQEIAISPIDKDLVLVGGVNGFRSTDGGQNWEKYLDGYWEEGLPYFYVHSDHHEMQFLPNSNIVINGNDGGVFKGDASANTPWEDLSSGLGITQYYNVSGTPQDANKLILGAQDNDVAVYNGANFIAQNPGSDGVEGLWDYTNSDIAWSGSQSGILERTMDGFASTEILETPEGAPFVWQLEIHPTTPTTIYGGFQDINMSTNRGDSWTSLNSGFQALIEAIAIAPSDANTIFVAGDNELKKTSNGGSSWSDVTTPQTGIIKDVVVHPTNTSEVYICYSGYSAGRVYKSTDGGSNWTNISAGLPNVPCLRMEYQTGEDVLYVANDLGVFFKENPDANWSRFGTGLPNVSVSDLAINYATNELRVSTFGRGLWEISLDDSNVGLNESVLDESHVTIYPNPTENNSFTLRLNDLEGATDVLVYNLVGGVVKNFEMTGSSVLVDLTGLPQGLYCVKISNQGKSSTQRVVLK